MKKRVKSISIKIPLSKIIRSFRRENHLHLPLVRPLHRDNKIVACLVRRGMGQNTSKRGYLFQTQPFQITRLFCHEHFRISFEETGFTPRNRFRVESCRGWAGVMDSAEIWVCVRRTTLRLTGLLGNDVLQTLMRISPLGGYSV